jgi:glycosyltransferase involved in cell wall biosynthesis
MISVGFNVSVITPPPTQQDVLNLPGLTFYFIDLNPTSLSLIGNAKSLFYIIKTLYHIRPDYLMTFTIKPAIFGAIFAFLSSKTNFVPTITGLGSFLYKDKNVRSGRIWLLSRVLYRAKAIFVQNSDDLKIFQKHMRNNKKIRVVPGSGIDVTKYDQRDLSRPVRRVLFLGRLLQDKGVEIFMQAAMNVLQKNNCLYDFTIIGHLDKRDPRAPNREIYDRFVGTENCIHIPHVEDVTSELKHYDLLVLPSDREGCSRAILEACAAKLLVCTTDVPGCNSIINSVSGFLLADATVDELSNVLNGINLISSNLLQEKTTAAFEHVAMNFSNDRVQDIYLEEILK